MATSAAELQPRVRERQQPAPRAPRARERESTNAGMATGVLWIAVVAILLAGVVALNVTLLKLNVELDQLGRERADLRAENAALSSRLSTAAAGPRIQALARAQGLVPVEPDEMVYLRLARTSAKG